MRYWLMKSEPGVYSIDNLKRDGKTYWDGVRNFQARNFMRDGMKKGDLVLFYHSNAEPSAVAGVARIVKEGYPDFTAWDPKDVHYDPRSSADKPQWSMVDVAFVEKFSEEISLFELKSIPALKGMMLLKKGSRLSVQPVDEAHFEIVRKMGRKR